MTSNEWGGLGYETATDTNMSKPNPIKYGRVVLLIILSPLIVPAYFAGVLASLLYISSFCGFKNTENYFMAGLGFESNEQILDRILKERCK